MTFFAANLLKLFEGAWVPLLFGVVMAVLIWTWRRGAAILVAEDAPDRGAARDLIKSLEKRPPHIVQGTAVFLTSDPEFRADRADAQSQAQQGAARAQRHPDHRNRRHAARRSGRPGQDGKISEQFTPGALRFGYMELPNVPKALVHRAQARLAVRHHVDLVLRVAALAQAGRRIRACRAGRIGCSSRSADRQTMPPTTSRSRPAGWWSWHPGHHLISI